LKPAYNQQLKIGIDKAYKRVDPKPSSFLGKKHTPQAIELFRTYALARVHPPKPGYELTITDLHTNLTTSYSSIRKGVEAMGWDQPSIMRRFRKGTIKPYRNRYVITKAAPKL